MKHFNRKKGHRLFSVILTAALIFSSLTFSVPVTAYEIVSDTVYISPDGDDSGAGTKEAPFATLAKAFSVLDESSGGTAVIMGDIESENAEAWNLADDEWTNSKHENLLTITGKDPETGTIYTDATLRYAPIGLCGPTKIEYVNIITSREYVYINSCGYDFTIGKAVTALQHEMRVHDGIGETVRKYVDSTNFTLDGGLMDVLFVGGGYSIDPRYGVLGDCNVTINGGELSRMIVGFDSYSASHTTGTIGGNIKITINDGNVGGISTTLITDNTVGGFVSLIFNKSKYASYELPDANDGVYVIRSGYHGRVDATDKAGVFMITPDPGYAAYIGTEKLGSGEQTLEPGETVITYFREGVSVEVIDSDDLYAQGFPDGTFRPDEPISRAESLELAVRASTDKHYIENAYSSSELADISASDWYFGTAAFAESIGIMPDQWISDGILDPHKDMTRGEFVHIVDGLIARDYASIKLFDFSDVTEDHPYYNAIMHAAQGGYINGYENGEFLPDNTITRAEAVTIVNRYLERVPYSDAKAEFADTADHWASGQIAAASTHFTEGKWHKSSAGEAYVLPSSGGAESYIKALYNSSSELSGEAMRDGVDTISEQMKKDILSTPNTAEIYGARMTGTIYYVSEKNGDDLNSGTSPESPLKTISKVRALSLSAGDAVLFERGGIYRGTIYAADGVVYGSYGEGEKPLIMQSKMNYANPELWVETEYPNVYRCTNLLANVGVIGFDHDLFDHSEATYNETYGLIMNLNTRGFDGPQELCGDLQFYSQLGSGLNDVGNLYVYSTEGNPGERFSSIEIGERFDIFDGSPNNCVIDNIAMKFTGAHAIGFGTLSNLTVTNCVFSWLGGSVLNLNSDGSATNYGNAVEIYGGCDGYTVENCWIYQIYDTGVTHQRSASTGDCIQRNVNYLSNLIEYVFWGIEFYNAPPTSAQLNGAQDTYTRITENVLSAYNVLRCGGFGWGSITRFRSSILYCSSTISENRNCAAEYNIYDRAYGYLLQLQPNSTEIQDKNIYIQHIGQNLGRLRTSIFACDYSADEYLRDYWGDQNAVTIIIDNVLEPIVRNIPEGLAPSWM